MSLSHANNPPVKIESNVAHGAIAPFLSKYVVVKALSKHNAQLEAAQQILSRTYNPRP